jgi:protein SCO1/2
VVALLQSALERIRGADQPIDLTTPEPTRGGATTAAAELTETLAAIEAAPRSCCGAVLLNQRRSPEPAALTDIDCEDQDGAALSLAAFFAGRPGLLTFFYTRCMNPEKCSLTISKLGRLRTLAVAQGLGDGIALAGMTYDPAFDLPHRLKDYGAARGLDFAGTCRLLRTTGPFAPVRALFDLLVGYGEATVNRHAVEVILVQPDGTVAEHRSRTLWEPAEMLGLLAAMPA